MAVLITKKYALLYVIPLAADIKISATTIPNISGINCFDKQTFHFELYYLPSMEGSIWLKKDKRCLYMPQIKY